MELDQLTRWAFALGVSTLLLTPLLMLIIWSISTLAVLIGMLITLFVH